MNILAIESSCDETAAAVVKDGRTVLSDAIASQADMHAIYGGVVPEIASRKHVEAIAALTDQALREAGVTRDDIDAVAVTYGPGLIGALLVGVNFPFLTPAQADTLVDAIGDADACVYTIDGVPQPLFGVYRKRCMSFAETMMLNGDYDIRNLLNWANTVYIPLEDTAPFRSVDTPADLEEAENLI